MAPDPPTLRSTKTRRRGWTPARQKRFDVLIERYRYPADDRRPIDVLDIGVGHGETTVGSALQHPEQRHVAVELHLPGVGRLLDALERHQLQQVRVAVADAVVFLGDLPAHSVGEVRVLFPDPWPKARHHVRRLVRPDVVASMRRVLRPGGVVHLTTDHEGYATWMRDVMERTEHFAGGIVDRPSWRVDSRYSRRAEAAGRPVTDLRYELSGEVPSA